MARNLYFYLSRPAAIKSYFFILFFAVIFAIPIVAESQIINTVAGNGTWGYSGDGGPATAAQINYPWGTASDNSGNLFIAGDDWWWWSSSYSRVRKVDAFGTITTYAGTGTPGFSGDGGPATAAQLYYPSGVATDAAGNLYISDYGNYRIRKVNAATGIITTIAGNGTWGYSGDGGPATAAAIENLDNGIAADAAGNVYFYNWAYNRVRKVDTSGIITTFAGNGTAGFSGDGGAATAAKISYDVYGIAVDASGNVYIADFGNFRIRMVNTSGIISTVAGNGGFGSSGDGGAATAAQIGEPIGVAVDNAGNIHIGDYYNNRIRKVNASGIISTEAGTGVVSFSGDGGPATAATFNRVYAVSADGGGNVYVSDFSNARVRKIINNNRPPRFTGGHTQNLTVCENTVGDSINSLLGVMDSDVVQTETWSLLSAPHHGTAVILDTTLSTGAVLAAHHNFYTPTTGYSGLDTFKVTVNDGYAIDTTTIYVTINPIPATITGGGSFPVGGYSTLACSSGGGTWSSSASATASVSSSGLVTGVSVGTATITYTFTSTGCINTKTVNVFAAAGTLITTVAGNGTAGSSGDGGAATAASLSSPWGAAVDAAGNIYIADEANNKVRKVSATGTISTIAGTGTAGFAGDGGAATAAQLNHPYDVAVDGSGNVYIADNGNHRVRIINSTGTISTFAGSSSSTYSGDGGAATAAGLGAPSGITLDGSGNVYICADGARVRKVNTSGIITLFAGTTTTGYSGDGGPATAAQLHNPVSVAADASGNIFIADQLNNYIRKVNTSGIISTVVGNGSASYSGDGGPATSASINNPWGITIDALGNMYIGDHGSNRVRKVNVAGTISTAAGTGTAGYSGDGCAASSAQINTHWGICTDGLGNVYIADGSNNRIRKIYANHAPSFNGGHSQTSSVCQNSTDSLNSLLAITDLDVNQAETWSVITPAVNGSVTATYSATSTGGIITPSGLYYIPALGFTGADSFTIRVNDCGIGSDTTVIHITVTPPPSSITGASSVCTGLTTTLTDPVGSGTWSSSSPATATVGSSTGVVTGVAGGTVTISYSPGAGCSVTKAMTINTSPAVTGTHNICIGTPTTFTASPSGGIWSSSSSALVTVGSSSGLVSGSVVGTATITYTQGACYTSYPVTVNAAAPAITGLPIVCIGAPQALFDIGGSGVWSSSSPSIAAIDSFTGIATGVSAGTATMTYTLPAGCYATTTFYVNPLPSPISGSPTVCVGQTATYTDASGGGEWTTSGLSSSATIDTFTGVLTGVTPGTQTILYTSLATGCSASMMVTVNSAPSAITGADTICAGATTTLTNSITGGTWTSSNPAKATIGATSGIVTGIAAGTTTISYIVSGGCYATMTMTVRATPAAISGASTVCVGLTTALTDATTPGTWSSSGAIASVGSASGIVTGATAGIATITYTAASTGCATTKNITVNTSPASITGSLQACIGIPDTVHDVTPGGTWTSSASSVATIGSSGIIAPLTTGTTTVTYSLGAGCSTTAIITVNPLPALISGSPSVCTGSTTTLSDATVGGTWSSTGSAATIGSTGIVSGATTGSVTVTYTAAGCPRTITVTVNPVPAAISGPSTVCIGSTATLTDLTTGGSWSSGSTTIAAVGSSTGIVTGGTTGATSIIYTLPTGCSSSKIITVNSLPAAIGGPSSVCQGANITLTDATTPGSWSTTSAIAAVGSASGIVTGISAGTAIISYTISTSCTATKTISINPLPAITGPTAVCVSATMTETSTPGGTWTSSTPAVATIGSLSGVVTGITTGTSNITYTLPTGCATGETVTVSLSPSSITGAATVCAGATTTLTDGVPGGTWASSSPATASIGSLSGTVSGIVTGPVTITYSLGSGCTTTRTMTVTTSPSAISGTTSLCVGTAATLGSSPSGGAWSSAATGTATVGSTGIVTGIASGSTTISYTVAGCSATAGVTVNTTPAAISGPTIVCTGATATETDITPGGLWSTTSSNITIGSASGIVNGISSGPATITYAIGSCTATRSISVNAVSPITGATGICVGATATLSSPGGGTWSSSSPAIATIGSSTGTVTGIAPGTTTITYALGTGCTTAVTITVNTAPSTISGPLHACTAATSTLTDATGGGIWTSGSPAIASIGSLSGIVTGITSGTTLITYSLGSGCTATATVTVTASPAAISGTPQVCQGAITTVGDPTPGGTWSSAATATATIGAATGTISGVAAGTATISYTLASGCAAITTVTVNPQPAAISGTTRICTGLTATLSDITTGGTWSTASTTTAAIGTGTGIITGGTPGFTTITYTLPTGCTTTAIVTVNAAPVVITGTTTLCIGSAATLGDASPGGSWSSADPAVATIGTTGTVIAMALGTATISYTLGGCPATTDVTVNPLPAAISGTPNLCAGLAATFTDPATGGTWGSSNPLIATVGATTGIVTGMVTGTATITYTTGPGCIVNLPVTVNASPAPISGRPDVCLGATATLSDVTPGGSWSTSDPAIAAISSSGTVTGVAAGTATISYTGTNGCPAILGMNVIQVKPIDGITSLCAWGDTLSVSDSTPGGTYSSTLVTTTTAGSGLGTVITYAPGTATIYYTLLPSGCSTSATLTVNPLPGPITGDYNVCTAATTMLADAAAGGTWSTLTPSIASISTTGVATGIIPGRATIRYTLPTGCKTDTIITVAPAPSAITGVASMCAGAAAMLTDTVSGGSWSSSSPATAPVSATGIVTGTAAGTAVITYSMAASCMATKTVTIQPLPTAYTVTGGGNYCAGGTGVHIGLSSSHSGISYQLYRGTATGSPLTGTGTAIDFGLQTAAGAYTVSATDAATGCSNNMSGSVTVAITPTVTPAVSISTLPGTSVCSGTPVAFTAVPVNGGATPGYQWSINAVSAGTGGTFSYIPLNGDIISVLLTSSATCATPGTVTALQTMTVTPPQVPAVTITAHPGTTISTGQYDTLIATVSGGGAAPTYQWEVNSTTITGANTPTYITNTLANGDTVKCIVTNTDPCGQSTTRWTVVTVLNSTTGVTTINGEDLINILPNPNRGTFAIKGQLAVIADEAVTIEVTDMLGQVVYRKQVIAGNGRLEEQVTLGSSVANGMYLLNVRTENGNKVFHIVVEQ